MGVRPARRQHVYVRRDDHHDGPASARRRQHGDAVFAGPAPPLPVADGRDVLLRGHRSGAGLGQPDELCDQHHLLGEDAGDGNCRAQRARVPLHHRVHTR